MGRIITSGLVAGIVVFIWGAISHMATPLGTIGIQSLPDDEAFTTLIRASLTRSGFYFFPAMPHDPSASRAQQDAAMKAFAEKERRGPVGIMVIRTGGVEPMSMRMLASELVSNILAAIVAAMLLSMGIGSPGLATLSSRVFFVTMLGLFASLSIEVSYWTWYGFPTNYTLAQFVDQLASWMFGGLVLGALIKPRS
jgi:hypothetical protein